MLWRWHSFWCNTCCFEWLKNCWSTRIFTTQQPSLGVSWEQFQKIKEKLSISSSFVKEKDLLMSEENRKRSKKKPLVCSHCIIWLRSSIKMQYTSNLEAVDEHNDYFVRFSMLQGFAPVGSRCVCILNKLNFTFPTWNTNKKKPHHVVLSACIPLDSHRLSRSVEVHISRGQCICSRA